MTDQYHYVLLDSSASYVRRWSLSTNAIVTAQAGAGVREIRRVTGLWDGWSPPCSNSSTALFWLEHELLRA
jgi:hypothetical protein